MFELLGTILEFFWDCFPRPVMVAANERASRFLFGRDVDGTQLEGVVRQDFGPGCYILLPVFEDWQQQVVASQQDRTGDVLCQSRDGSTWQVEMSVEFEIHSLPQFDIAQLSGDDHIRILVREAAVRTAAARMNDEMAEKGPHSFCCEVEGRVEEELLSRGVNILQVRIQKWQSVTVLHLSGLE